MWKSEGRTGTWWEQSSLRWTLVCDSAQLWPSLIRHRTGLGIQTSSSLFSHMELATLQGWLPFGYSPVLAVLLVCSVLEPPEQSVKVDVLIWLPHGDGRKFFSMSRSFYLPAAWDSAAFTFPVCCWSFVPWTVGKINTCYYKILLPRGGNEGAWICNSLVWAAGWSSALGAPIA